MRTQILSVSLALAVASGVAATSVYSQSPQSGVSIAETKALLERELPLAGDFSVVIKPPSGPARETRFVINKVSLSDCRLSILRTEQPFYNSPDLRDLIVHRHAETVVLKDVDVSKIKVVESPVATGYSASRPYYLIPLVAFADGGTPFSDETEGGGNPRKISAKSWVTVSVVDNAAATRIAEALRQAAVLCGSPDQPVGKPDEPSTSATSTTMTNEDVVKLVAAGLSDQVIATSIRQAATKDFDLTPAGLVALKKAGVSDPVIVAMLEKGPGSQAAAAGDAKTAPKYDAGLAKPKAPVAPPEPSNGCEGIEAMGLYKNNTGVGGLVEWLAKIRNNSGVTRIVIYGWMDMYGQPQKGQVEIQGGQISSIRLDLTQNMVIPPVKDLRLLSCR